MTEHCHHWSTRHDDEGRLVLHCTDRGCEEEAIPWTADECAARRQEHAQWMERRGYGTELHRTTHHQHG